MEWVASTLHTTSEHGVSSITTADAHTSTASSRTDAPADLNGLVYFAERLNLVSALVPLYFNWPLPVDFLLVPSFRLLILQSTDMSSFSSDKFQPKQSLHIV